VAILSGRGVTMVGPVEGRQASGRLGSGRMAEVEAIVAAVGEALQHARVAGGGGLVPAAGDGLVPAARDGLVPDAGAGLSPSSGDDVPAARRGSPRTGWPAGAHVVITGGGTREPIDSVRFIGNRSSGKMADALAAEALALGARVTLITAAAPPPPSERLSVVTVETAAEMRDAVLPVLPETAVLIMAAAVADQRPVTTLAGKVPKDDLPSQLALVPTEDILLSVRDHPSRGGVIVVGFAAETGPLLENARAKLRTKGLDHIVANDVGVEGIGMGTDDNAVVILSARGRTTHVPRTSKRQVAAAVFEAIQAVSVGSQGRPSG
ncbi:MAG: phosphopantothenoylcysteine decarboxylase, partial [Candidatus Dormibacteria bacterium]